MDKLGCHIGIMNMLKVIRTNNYGDHCYQETQASEIPFGDLNFDQIWAIETPSDYSIQYFQEKNSKCQIREYNNVPFLMSPKAFECVPIENTQGGSASVISFTYNNNKYYLMVADNKKYLQNVAGSMTPGESYIECAEREIKEEVGIEKVNLKEIGSFSFTHTNKLVNVEWEMITKIFYSEVNISDIQHLFPKDFQLSNDQVNIISVDQLESNLNEIEKVFIIPETQLKNLPETIEEKAFGNHHRSILHILSFDENPFNVSYLKSFNVSK